MSKYESFDRSRLLIKPLAERAHDLHLDRWLALTDPTPPFEHPRMWNCELWGRHDDVSKQQNIDIDRAWPPAHSTRSAFPAEFALNALDHSQQLQRKIPRLAFNNQVQKPSLLNHALRLCFVNRRLRKNVNVLSLQRTKRPF